jgi:hypothetical protein
MAACALAEEGALNKVDFPTSGKPAIPHCKPLVYFFQAANNKRVGENLG